MWGDFGGALVIGTCDMSMEAMLPESTIFGLAKSASHFLGTWRSADGTTYRMLRSVLPYESPAGRRHLFTSRGGTMLEHAEEEANLYSGPIWTSGVNGVVRFETAGSNRKNPFLFESSANGVHWCEDSIADLRGTQFRPAFQWLNPWRSGGAYCVTAMYRMKGSILGQELEGFMAHEIHYFPPGRTFFDSPFGWGGREITWGHMATEYEDGTCVVASLATGNDGWGFAMLYDEAGEFHGTTALDVRVRVRSSGFPQEIRFSFLGQDWIWQAAPDGERAPTVGGGHVGGEGILRRAGERRRVVRAMGTIDWWLDGRGAHLNKNSPQPVA
jgi:hypothetical protein